MTMLVMLYPFGLAAGTLVGVVANTTLVALVEQTVVFKPAKAGAGLTVSVTVCDKPLHKLAVTGTIV